MKAALWGYLFAWQQRDARLDDAEKRAREHKRLFDSTKPQPQSAGSSAALPE